MVLCDPHHMLFTWSEYYVWHLDVALHPNINIKSYVYLLYLHRARKGINNMIKNVSPDLLEDIVLDGDTSLPNSEVRGVASTSYNIITRT